MASRTCGPHPPLSEGAREEKCPEPALVPSRRDRAPRRPAEKGRNTGTSKEAHVLVVSPESMCFVTGLNPVLWLEPRGWLLPPLTAGCLRVCTGRASGERAGGGPGPGHLPCVGRRLPADTAVLTMAHHVFLDTQQVTSIVDRHNDASQRGRVPAVLSSDGSTRVCPLHSSETVNLLLLLRTAGLCKSPLPMWLSRPMALHFPSWLLV